MVRVSPSNTENAHIEENLQKPTITVERLYVLDPVSILGSPFKKKIYQISRKSMKTHRRALFVEMFRYDSLHAYKDFI